MFQYPVFLCTEETVRYLPNDHEQVVLLGGAYGGCGNILNVAHQIHVMKRDERQDELWTTSQTIFRDICLHELSETIKELTNNNNNNNNNNKKKWT